MRVILMLIAIALVSGCDRRISQSGVEVFYAGGAQTPFMRICEPKVPGCGGQITNSNSLLGYWGERALSSSVYRGSYYATVENTKFCRAKSAFVEGGRELPLAKYMHEFLFATVTYAYIVLTKADMLMLKQGAPLIVEFEPSCGISDTETIDRITLRFPTDMIGDL